MPHYVNQKQLGICSLNKERARMTIEISIYILVLRDLVTVTSDFRIWNGGQMPSKNGTSMLRHSSPPSRLDVPRRQQESLAFVWNLVATLSYFWDVQAIYKHHALPFATLLESLSSALLCQLRSCSQMCRKCELQVSTSRARIRSSVSSTKAGTFLSAGLSQPLGARIRVVSSFLSPLQPAEEHGHHVLELRSDPSLITPSSATTKNLARIGIKRMSRGEFCGAYFCSQSVPPVSN